MYENKENDKMTEEEEEQEDNEDDNVPAQTPKDEKLEAVKSSSPVVYIALILASFFALGVYEVSWWMVLI